MSDKKLGVPFYDSPFAVLTTAFPSQSDNFLSFEPGGSKQVQGSRQHSAQESNPHEQLPKPCHFYSIGGAHRQNDANNVRTFFNDYAGNHGNYKQDHENHWHPRHKTRTWHGKSVYQRNTKVLHNKSDRSDISAYIHPSFLEDPWRHLIANLEQWTN